MEIQLKGNQSLEVAKTLDTIGIIYYEKKNFKLALEYFEKAI